MSPGILKIHKMPAGTNGTKQTIAYISNKVIVKTDAGIDNQDRFLFGMY